MFARLNLLFVFMLISITACSKTKTTSSNAKEFKETNSKLLSGSSDIDSPECNPAVECCLPQTPQTCQASCKHSDTETPACLEEVKKFVVEKNYLTDVKNIRKGELTTIKTLELKLDDAKSYLRNAKIAKNHVRDMLGIALRQGDKLVCYNPDNISIYTPMTVGTLAYQLMDAAAPDFNCTSAIGSIIQAVDSPQPQNVCEATTKTFRALTGVHAPIALTPTGCVDPGETTIKCAEAILGSSGTIKFSCPGPKIFKNLTACKIWSPATVVGGMAVGVGSFLWDNMTCMSPNQWVRASRLSNDLMNVLSPLEETISSLTKTVSELQAEVDNYRNVMELTLKEIGERQQKVRSAAEAMEACRFRADLSLSKMKEMRVQCGLR